MNKFKKVIAMVLVAVAVSVSVGTVVNAGILGIDVSKYQGAINWGATTSSGVQYAMIKAGSVKGMDPNFASNMVQASSTGMRTGVYMYSYATSVEGAIAEANLLLSWIQPYSVSFPVAFDFEDPSQKGIDPFTATAMANAFCDVIANAGYYPIVYTYRNFYNNHLTAGLRYDKWIAQYTGGCDVPGYAMWQYTSSGSVNGVAGRVDMNMLEKDYFSLIPAMGFLNTDYGTYFFTNYRKQRGWVSPDGVYKYHMGDTFLMDKGWFSDGTGIYYLSDQDGHALVGLNAIGGNQYFFNENGQMQTGYQNIGGLTYLFDASNGAMVTGWVPTGTGMQYFTSDGWMVANMYLEIDGAGRAFDAQGNLLVNGVYNVGGITVLCAEDGTAIPYAM